MNYTYNYFKLGTVFQNFINLENILIEIMLLNNLNGLMLINLSTNK